MDRVVVPVVLVIELRQAFVPEVAAVERVVDGILAAPEQPAGQAVAQLDALAPGGNGGGKL